MKKLTLLCIVISFMPMYSCNHSQAPTDQNMEHPMTAENKTSPEIAPKIQTAEERKAEIKGIFEKYKEHKTKDCAHHTLKEILAKGPEFYGAEIYKCNLTDSLTLISIEIDVADIFEWSKYFFIGKELICSYNGWVGYGSKDSYLIYDTNKQPIDGAENGTNPEGKKALNNKKINNFKTFQKSHSEYLKYALKEMGLNQ